MARYAALLLLVLVLDLRSPSQAVQRAYIYKGKTIHYFVRTFRPPVPMSPDLKRMNQDSAANCAILFLSRLRDDDIQGAAQLTTNPEHVFNLYSKSRARIGGPGFLDQISKVFGDNLNYVHELVIGNEHALIVDKLPGLAHYLRERNGTFLMEFPQLGFGPSEIDQLSVLVNENEAGKLKFE